MIPDQANLSGEELEFFVTNWTRASPNVYGYVLAIIRRRHDVDDVMQEVAITVCKKLHAFDRNREFMPWVLTIARLHALDYLRKTGRHQLILSNSILESIEDPISKMDFHEADYRDALVACVERLQPQAAKIVRMRYESGFSVKDIAGRIGSKPNTISQILARSRAALMRCVSRHVGEVSK